MFLHHDRLRQSVLHAMVCDKRTGQRHMPPLGRLGQHLQESVQNNFSALNWVRAYCGARLAVFLGFSEFYTAWPAQPAASTLCQHALGDPC